MNQNTDYWTVRENLKLAVQNDDQKMVRFISANYPEIFKNVMNAAKRANAKLGRRKRGRR